MILADAAGWVTAVATSVAAVAAVVAGVFAFRAFRQQAQQVRTLEHDRLDTNSPSMSVRAKEVSWDNRYEEPPDATIRANYGIVVRAAGTNFGRVPGLLGPDSKQWVTFYLSDHQTQWTNQVLIDPNESMLFWVDINRRALTLDQTSNRWCLNFELTATSPYSGVQDRIAWAAKATSPAEVVPSHGSVDARTDEFDLQIRREYPTKQHPPGG